MQTAMMPPPSGPSGPPDPMSFDPRPPQSTPPQFPHQAGPPSPFHSTDTSPSTSTNPGMTMQSPHQSNGFTYPSLNYPDPGYYGQEGWTPPPPFYPPPQNFQRYNNRYNPRFPNNTQNQTRFPMNGPGSYPQQPFYPQGYQMGGPGPGTMQNGYQNYPIDVPPFMRGPQYNGPAYPTPPESMDGPQFSKTQPNGSDSLDNAVSQNDSPPYHQHPQPPSIPPPDHPDYRGPPNPGYSPNTNTGPSPNPPGPPFQSFYPPGHPYAYGGGVGYPPYFPPQFSPYPFDPNAPQQFPQQPLQSQPPQERQGYKQVNGGPGKGLNPAAAGFNFVPSKAREQPVSSAPPPMVAADAGPMFAGLPQESFQPELPNGHADPSWGMGAIVNEDQFKNIVSAQAPKSEPKSQGLGLERMDLSQSTLTMDSQPTSTDQSTSTTFTQSENTPAMSLSPTTPTTPMSVRTPKAGSDAQSSAVSPKPSQPADQLNFVGPTVSGYASPDMAPPRTPSLGQAMSVIAKVAPKAKAQPIAEILRLVSVRPGQEISGNTYAAALKSRIPKSVKTETVDVSSEKRVNGKKRSRPLKLASLVSVGSRTRLSQPPPVLLAQIKLSFGSIDQSPHTTPAAPANERVQTPPPLPRAKPSSWAALLKPEGSTPSTSTRNVSPVASSTPLSPRSDAGPSYLGAIPSTHPLESARSITPPTQQIQGVPLTPASLPALSGQVAPGPSRPRPVFSYAGAAAAGATMTPQQELARLLSEGIKGKGKDVRGTLPRGLINTGNMCFANTILQVLVYCPPFAELLEELGKRLKADLARRTPLLEAMIIFLREFISTPGQPTLPQSGTSTPHSKDRDPRKDAFIPENVYDAMKENKRFDSMRRGFQEDAEEYLGFFLNTLHEELLWLLSQTQAPRASRPIPNGSADTAERSIQRPISPSQDPGADEPWLEVGKKQKTNVVRNTETRETAVSRLFGGTLRSVLHIPGSKDSVTLEPYQPLQLDVDSPTVLSITDALRQLNAPETVPGVWSPSRATNVDATKQVYLETFPPALILHLKRFVYDSGEMAVVKRFKPVAYGTELVVPPEIISPSRRGASGVKYRLFGVVYHHGSSASGGHYTVSVSRQDAGGWIHFDDENVSTIPVDQVVVSEQEAKDGRSGVVGPGLREKCAYLLFYLRAKA